MNFLNNRVTKPKILPIFKQKLTKKKLDHQFLRNFPGPFPGIWPLLPGGLQLPVHVQTKKKNCHFWVVKNGLFSLLFPTVCTCIGSWGPPGGIGHIPGRALGKFLKNWRSSYFFVNFCLKIGKFLGFVTQLFQKFISTVYTVISKQKIV